MTLGTGVAGGHHGGSPVVCHKDLEDTDTHPTLWGENSEETCKNGTEAKNIPSMTKVKLISVIDNFVETGLADHSPRRIKSHDPEENTA